MIPTSILQKCAPAIAQYKALPSRQRSMVKLFLLFLSYYFIYTVMLAPIKASTRSLTSQSATLEAEMMANRQAAQEILTQVKESIANPNSVHARSLNNQMETLNQGLSVYYGQAVPARGMGTVLRNLLGQDKSMTLVKLNSLPSVEVLSSDASFAELSKIDNRPKLFKRGVEIVFRGNFNSTYQYLKKIEDYDKKIFWDDLVYTVIEYPMAEVTLTVYTLSQEEGWISG